jgi:hypothetical protein
VGTQGREPKLNQFNRSLPRAEGPRYSPALQVENGHFQNVNLRRAKMVSLDTGLKIIVHLFLRTKFRHVG